MSEHLPLEVDYNCGVGASALVVAVVGVLIVVG